MMRVRLCAPSAAFARADAERVLALGVGHAGVTLDFHPQCFAVSGHFAGNDALRLAAFVECANDPDCDAVWFARGGYGAARIVEDALPLLGEAARGKLWLGYSDAGTMLGALYRAGIGRPVHAPMPADIRREGGEAAVRRVLDWFGGDRSGEEPGLDSRPAVAFNLMTLAMLAGTPLMPDLAGHVVMVEEVSEHLYAVDRLFFHLTAVLAPMGIAGLRLGRVSDIPENDRPFGFGVEEIARHWCDRRGIAWLGYADIGHDADNRIVPFGLAAGRQGQ
ncbi:peptidase U61, LD-carboxypeptidase A [Novosphingobium nitrogenifigens DSM 19370]|uniref:Peptidase U61, LD-carboxypeptidase A n=1 Tax=Novosphingobium nitrogenifigens DSM 19370 TaxID=983920 RepID=F1Z882_9SPHN|nr:LD-carboxypeptidase [Novosphingobium nitrogenifigens]EGD59143.1 peptidase U61, LD-carboxypeptidase A [Novosphingobium nitrogenifigens DSM 19370]